MRRIQKILGGMFLAGVLIGGVGTGIAMVEYSSLVYGGEKLIGEDSLVTKTLDFDFEPDGRTLEVAENRFWERNRVQRIEIDNTVPAGTVRFEVTYNERTVTPDLGFEAYEEEETEIETIPEETTDMDSQTGEEPEIEIEPESMADGAYEEEYTDDWQTPEEEYDEIERQSQDGSDKKEKPGKIGTVFLTASYHERGFATLMENKDFVLAELKQGRISSYDVAYITDVRIKVNQETAPYIESSYVIR